MGDSRQPLLPALGAVLLALGACDLGASGLASLDGGTDATGGGDAAGGRDAAPDTTTGGADATDSPAPPPFDAGVDALDAADSAGSNDAGSDACAVEDGGTSDTVVATHATSPPTIDGNLGDWPCPNFHSMTIQNAGYTVAAGGGPVQASAGISADFAVGWDTSYLYFAAIVTDPSLDGNDPQPFNNDSVEFYVSNDSPLNGDYSANDHQIVVDYNDNVGEYSNGNQVTVTGFTAGTQKTANSYTVEARLDVAQVGLSSASAGETLGFDFVLNDTAGGVPEANVLFWHVVPQANCGCPGGCCCNSLNPQVPYCSTLADGTETLAP